LSDEHNKRVTGCYGHPMIRTPNIDKLASLGTRFTPAYTNGPICVPARASFATGQYVHKIRYWDNAIAYFGLVSFLDDNIGKILGTLEETGLAENTRVIYSSDHGDNLGTRGMWGKSTMYEESAGIPLIMAGPEVPQGNVCNVSVMGLQFC
jgi:arylsulfatase A-like enzyme